jgi:hypothetical protein
MSQNATIEQTFASGRYSKRKRTQVAYFMNELDVSDDEADFEAVQAKVRRIDATNASYLTPSRSAKPPHRRNSQSARSSPSWNCPPRSAT